MGSQVFQGPDAGGSAILTFMLLIPAALLAVLAVVFWPRPLQIEVTAHELALLPESWSCGSGRFVLRASRWFVWLVAERAARQPPGEEERDGEASGDEGVGEVSLRPRRRSHRRDGGVPPRGEKR